MTDRLNALFSLKDEVIVLTGGYGLIGAALSKGLVELGAKVGDEVAPFSQIGRIPEDWHLMVFTVRAFISD